jgi:hypothetical protein
MFYKNFENWCFNVKYLRASVNTSCNLVFFLQLSVVFKDNVSKISESYT